MGIQKSNLNYETITKILKEEYNMISDDVNERIEKRLKKQ